MTRLQLALDVGSTAEASRIAKAAIDSIDIIEAGTVLVLNDGLKAVRELREQFPHHPLVADIRIGRAGAKFAAMAFDAGASIVTVLGECPMGVVEGAVAAAGKSGGTVEVELPEHWTAANVRAWADAGVSTLIAHRSGRFTAASDNEIRDVLGRLAECDLGAMEVTLAGGFSPGDSEHFAGLHYDIVAVGSAISKADDPGAVAAALRAELTRK